METFTPPDGIVFLNLERRSSVTTCVLGIVAHGLLLYIAVSAIYREGEK